MQDVSFLLKALKVCRQHVRKWTSNWIVIACGSGLFLALSVLLYVCIGV